MSIRLTFTVHTAGFENSLALSSLEDNAQVPCFTHISNSTQPKRISWRAAATQLPGSRLRVLTLVYHDCVLAHR
jgi:hypothetical protein